MTRSPVQLRLRALTFCSTSVLSVTRNTVARFLLFTRVGNNWCCLRSWKAEKWLGYTDLDMEFPFAHFQSRNRSEVGSQRLAIDSTTYRSKGSFSYDQSIAIFHRKIDTSSPSGNLSDASDVITSGGHRTQADVEKCGHKKTSFVGSGLKTRVTILHSISTRNHPQPDH
jgi:hypothetical protein